MTNHDANPKGKFLETLVAFLHEVAGDDVECNARLPTADGSGREREVDVLLKVASEELIGCPVHIPIECKNYGERVGVELIDAFVGKLQDLGIDTNLGIYVAASGYTSGAIGRAEAAGIKTLVAEGLTKDRLALEVQKALHSLVLWVAEWKSTSYFPFVPKSDGPSGSITVDLPPGASWETGSLDLIWELWLRGEIPCAIGDHEVTVKIQPNQLAICTIEVSAHGACLLGRVKSAALTDARNSTFDKQHIGLELCLRGGAIQLVRYANAKEMEKKISQGTIRLELRTPRIIGPKMYWPPSQQTANRVANLLATNQTISFDRVEGSNLLRAWVAPLAARMQPKSQ